MLVYANIVWTMSDLKIPASGERGLTDGERTWSLLLALSFVLVITHNVVRRKLAEPRSSLISRAEVCARIGMVFLIRFWPCFYSSIGREWTSLSESRSDYGQKVPDHSVFRPFAANLGKLNHNPLLFTMASPELARTGQTTGFTLRC